MADAAATMIANAVDVDHPAIERQPAHALRDDSDLGALPVTVSVGVLPFFAVQEALSRGVARTHDLRRRRSEEHTSELQSLMRISYAVFCLKKKTKNNEPNTEILIPSRLDVNTS